jgi:hypothetical protein
VILMIDSAGNSSDYAIREIGSADNDTANVIPSQANTLYLVGIDGNDQFEAYLETADVNIYMVAQTKGSVVYNVTDVPVTDPSLNSWQQIDATAYGVPTTATGVIFHAENEQNKRNDLGLREGDSTDDWNKSLAQNAHLQGPAGLNGLSEWGQYQGSANITGSVAAYTLGETVLVADIHADIDVLIRTETGAIRATLATHVATTTDIAAAGWLTKTATFTPPAHTIVAPTDYLEIDLFQHVTGNEGNSQTLDFMIDDNSLSIADQTHIENVAFRKGLVAAPVPATNLVATASGQKVGLTWDANTEPDIRGYDVLRSTASGGPYTQQNSAPVVENAFTDSGVSAGTTYYYVIQSRNDAGQISGYSNEANATP